MRDKLIELLSENFVDFCNVDIIAGHAQIRAITFRADEFADYLLAHGVTLAEDNNVLTNGDRIRAMTDEELAKELMFWRDDWGDFETPCGCYEDRDEASRKTVEWLKQPAKEET